MSARSDLLSAARTLAISVGGATDAKVIHAGAKGPRPPKPYLTVRLLTPGGGAHGPAERIDSLAAGVPQARMRERREATVSFQGYGTDSGAWLDAIQAGLDSPASLTAQATAGVAAILLTPVKDISALLDTEEEDRFSMELTLRYRYDSATAAQVAATTAVLDADLYRITTSDSDTLTADLTVATV